MSYLKNGIQSLVSSVTTSSHTGDLVETVIATYFIPANTFKAGDLMYLEYLVSSNTTGDIWADRFYINTTNDLSGSPVQLMYFETSGGTHLNWRDFFVLDSNTLNVFVPPTVQNNSEGGVLTTPYTQVTGIDLTIDNYLVQTVQIAANTSQILRNRAINFTRKRVGR